MRTCIWCHLTESNVTFNKEAHTFPRALGGNSICDNVCDICNDNFGSPKKGTPAVEVVLKEMLNISKYLLLKAVNQFPKNKNYKSEYFNINWDKSTILLKPRYTLKGGYQEKLGRLFKRGIYKVFLEERERQRGDALNGRYDFIREFACFDKGDYPVYIFKPKFDAIFFSSTDVEKPMIRFTEHSDEQDKNFRVFEYLIMGHYFCIPTSPSFIQLNIIDLYRKHLIQSNNAFGLEIIPITILHEIDFTFNMLNRQ